MIRIIKNNQSKLSGIFLLLFLMICFFVCSASTHAATKSISKCTINMPYSTIEYSGKAIKAEPDITDDSLTLLAGTDYTLSYSKNILPGKASVTISGKGKYSGKVIRYFSIIKKPISKCNVTLQPDYFVYDGKAKAPIIKIKNGTVDLTPNVSFTASISNNTKIGLASIDIMGKGNYTGNTTVDFYIGPANVTLDSATIGNNNITMRWKELANVDGYYIYKLNGSTKTYDKIASIAKTKKTFTITGLAVGTPYTYAIKGYKKAGTVTVVSRDYTILKKTTTVPEVTGFNSSDTLHDAIYISWDKIIGASGYMIYSYDYSLSKFCQIKDVTWNTDSCVVTGLKSSTSYVLAIKAYKKNSSGKIYSSTYPKICIKTKISYADQSLYVDGDSIAYGVGAGGYSYGDALKKKYGFQIKKCAVGGATLAISEAKSHIIDSVLTNFTKKYDYAILEGGINDYLWSVPLGNIHSTDTQTTAGALNTIFSHIKSKSPGIKLYFLIPHKIYDNGIAKRRVIVPGDPSQNQNYHDVCTTPNGQGCTYKDYYNMLIQICNKHNVTVIDLFTKSGIDACIESQRKLYTADADGIHPTKNIQIYTYAPIAANVMGLK